MRIEWTLNALSDLENIKEYISNDSSYYANIFVKGAFRAVKRLHDFPKIGRMDPKYATIVFEKLFMVVTELFIR